jgi:hypothetical protein
MISATAYSEASGGGSVVGETLTLNFEIGAVQALQASLTLTKPKEFSISPNPVREKLQIAPRNASIMRIQVVAIYDVTGRLVSRRLLANVRAEEATTDITNLEEGIYTVVIRREDFNTEAHKVIIIK